MALNRTPVTINFSQGLDKKTDPFQVPIGKFLSLNNSVFQKGGLLQKRNGYAALAALPDTTSNFLTTFNNNLTAIGNKFQALSEGTSTWVNKGPINPVSLKTLPLIRSNTNQSQADSVIALNGLVCTVYTDVQTAGTLYRYAIADSVTGQNVVAPTNIPVTSGAIAGAPRVFLLGNYFIIVFTNDISGVNHLQYVAISTANPTSINVAVDISSTYTPSARLSFDGIVTNGRLYLGWNTNAGGGSIKLTSLTTSLALSNTVTFAGHSATIMSLCADTTRAPPVIYAVFYDSGSSTGYVLAVDYALNTVLPPTQVISSGTIFNITSVAANNVCNFFYEVSNAYTYDGSIPTNFINKNTITVTGTVGSPSVMARSVGLASKAFSIDDTTYMLSVQQSTFQPTYFLLNSLGQVVAKLAYENAGGYLPTGLPNITVTDNVIKTPYLIKDLIEAVNKTQGAPNAAGVYSQTGINLASFTIGDFIRCSAEIGSDLHTPGGFLWMYDGYSPVEHLFHLWPEDIEAAWSATGGSMHAQPDGATNTDAYFYQVTYEWSDNQGNVFRSAPSVPLAVTTTGSGTAGSVMLDIPTLRLTYKLSNPVKIVVYRWSVAQQIYYQVTSITAPLMNDVTVDYVTFTDTQPDSAIIGNNIIYTTGGVLENIAAPATDIMTLWQTRLALLDSEDRNLLWISKQVIEGVPVETSDLLTLYVAPTIGSQGSTGPVTALSAMDDKLIVFKENAIYYFTGAGPDNTGANSQIGDPVFITATVGCANQSSIIFMPSGLMFQSDKGIWLLGRDLSTTYIGSPVETLTQSAKVQSAVSVPGTNQVRFTMDSGITLMYDYFYGQWGTFINVPAISSTLYNNLHTYLNQFGQVFQETPGEYLDASNPVLMSFTTGWINTGGIMDFQRAYEMYFLATYLSPHKLQIGIAYDYNPSPLQSTIVTPDNQNVAWGQQQLWGSGGPWGGAGNIEHWRVFFDRQKCKSFQVSVNEVYDASFGQKAGAGLTMSGLNLSVGLKDTRPRVRGSRQTG